MGVAKGGAKGVKVGLSDAAKVNVSTLEGRKNIATSWSSERAVPTD